MGKWATAIIYNGSVVEAHKPDARDNVLMIREMIKHAHICATQNEIMKEQFNRSPYRQKQRHDIRFVVFENILT